MTVTAELVKKLRDQTQAGMMACKKALEETQGNFEDAVDLLRKKGEIKAANCATKTAAEGRIEVTISADGKRAAMVEVNCQTDFTAREANFVAFTQELAQATLKAGVKDAQAALALKPSNQHESFDAWRKELITKIGENIQLRRLAELECSGRVGQYCHGNRIGVLVSIEGGNEELARDIAMHAAAANPKYLDRSQIANDVLEKEKEIYSEQLKVQNKPANIIENILKGKLEKFYEEVCLLDQVYIKDDSKKVGQMLGGDVKIKQFIRYELGEGIEKKSSDFAAEVNAQL